MLFTLYYLLFYTTVSNTYAYSKHLYLLTNKTKDYFDLQCIAPPFKLALTKKHRLSGHSGNFMHIDLFSGVAKPLVLKVTQTTSTEIDPAIIMQKRLHQILYGTKVQERDLIKMMKLKSEPAKKGSIAKLGRHNYSDGNFDIYPNGQVMRAETFQGKAGVHLPLQELLQPGHCRLAITNDKMQTAMNAFAIFLYCNVEDILKLPADYVLKSARTIAMMNVAREKLAATWEVVKGDRKTVEIPHWTLEMYRPLFKYLNGREMAKLNLSDPKILSFVGTHAELNRHQVGIVASEYIKQNPNWLEAKTLNLMNNLLCGMPINLMRKASSNIYLQLTRQLFYHIRACDSLQRRFYLHMMTKTEVLGKPYSWSERDVSRLGLLLGELEGPEFASINPEAVFGITSPVMMAIPVEILLFVTETQLKYLDVKPLNILARKIKAYQDKRKSFDQYNDDDEDNSSEGCHFDFICLVVYLGHILLA